jgi:hypothetical protein
VPLVLQLTSLNKMNRTEQISFYKKQRASAKEMKAVAMQNYNIAAQLESEALNALAMLGTKPEHSPKGFQLSEKEQLKLKASLTK